MIASGPDARRPYRAPSEVFTVRKFLVLAVPALLAVACGSSSKSSSPSQAPAMSGTVGGKAFTPKAAQAIKARHASCPAGVAPTGFSADALMIEATSAGADPSAASSLACSDLTDTGVTCRPHTDAQTLAIIVANVNLADPTVISTLTPGSYTVFGVPEGIGNPGGGAYAEMLGADPSCATSVSVAMSGSVVISDVSGPITGTVNLTFPNGSVTGTFSAPVCSGTFPEDFICTKSDSVIGTGALCGSTCSP
jgi:hypothetical protein